MAMYKWRGKDEKTGMSLGLAVMDEPEAPGAVDVATRTADVTPGKFRCTVEGCGKMFKVRHVSASHFRGKHAELNKSKNAWQKYVEPIG